MNDMIEVTKGRNIKHSMTSTVLQSKWNTPNMLSNNDLFIGFTENHRDFQLQNALGGSYPIKKGSLDEHLLWCVKDSTKRNGLTYYFDSPDDAERILKTNYRLDDKQKWFNK